MVKQRFSTVPSFEKVATERVGALYDVRFDDVPGTVGLLLLH